MSRDKSEVKIFEIKCVGYDVLHELSACHLALWRLSKIRATVPIFDDFWRGTGGDAQ